MDRDGIRKARSVRSNSNPVLIGFSAVLENLGPMIILWAVAVATAFGYYSIPRVTDVLNLLAQWQMRGGWYASFLTRFVFCGLLPGVFILSMKRLKARSPLSVVGVQTLLAGICGVVSGWAYELNAYWFGTGIDFVTVLVKTFVYQFVWVVVFFMPLGSVVYFWIGRDFSLRRTVSGWPHDFLRDVFLPNLIANWSIWVPLSLVIHLFPTPLQIQVTGLANAFLSVVLLTLGRREVTSRSVRRTGASGDSSG